MRSDLGKDIFAIVNLQGKILSAWFNPSVENLSQGYARELLALTQFVFPVEHCLNTTDGNAGRGSSGQYVASYRMIKGKTKEASETPLKSFLKKKVRYLEYRRKFKTEKSKFQQSLFPRVV